MIVVETIGSFMLFIFLMIAILTLVNIVTLQARVHYAITQAAQTVSMYSYVLKVTGVSDKIQNLEKNAKVVSGEANNFKKELNQMMDGLVNFDLNETKDHAGAAADIGQQWVADTSDDPQKTLSLMINYAISEGSHFAFGEAMQMLVGRYLSNGTMGGNEYLEQFNVEGGLGGLTFYDFSLFDFDNMSNNDSVLLTEDGDVVITVRYSIKYAFGSLPLPFSNFEVTQSVRTKAWLGGSGEGYE